MSIVLWVVAAAVGAFGFSIWSGAESAMHQILAGTIFTAAAVLVAGGAVVSAIEALPRRQRLLDAKIARDAAKLTAETRAS